MPDVFFIILYTDITHMDHTTATVVKVTVAGMAVGTEVDTEVDMEADTVVDMEVDTAVDMEVDMEVDTAVDMAEEDMVDTETATERDTEADMAEAMVMRAMDLMAVAMVVKDTMDMDIKPSPRIKLHSQVSGILFIHVCHSSNNYL